MATQTFNSADEITAHYEQQIAAAGDDAAAVANLRAERGERLAEFATQRAQAAEAVTRKALVDAAIAKHNIPAELRDMVERFETEEEINKAAERLGAVMKAPTSASLYGGGTGGGGTPPRQSKDQDGEFLTSFEQKYNNHEAMTPQEYQRYVGLRMGRHAYRALKENGKQHIWGNQPAPDFERY